MKILGHIFYRYLWVVFNIFLGYFYRYRRLKHTIGMENIPNDRPILLCCNHPNAFMDALLLGSTIQRRTWFLARSDVFRKKLLANFLGFVGIIPIYRLLEGAEHLSKNDITFDRCSKMLSENKSIIIYSEGLCIQERRLRKLKKGTARIAFYAEEKADFKLNLTIVPVGINYSATPWKFRKSMHIRIGKPFEVKKYEALYRTDKARAMNLFTSDLEIAMAEQLIIIDNKANDTLVAQLEEIFIKKWAFEQKIDFKNQSLTHQLTRQITHQLRAAENESLEPIALLREKCSNYFNKLNSLKIRDWVLEKNEIKAISRFGVFVNYFIFLICLPIFIAGVVTNYIPYKIPSLIAKKVVKHIEFNASINVALSLFLWQIYWLLQSLVVALAFRNWYVLTVFMILVPITGLIAQELIVLLKKSNGVMRFLASKNKNRVEELVNRRKEIVAEVELLKLKFPLVNE